MADIMNKGVISSLFITLLDTDDSCFREATALLPCSPSPVSVQCLNRSFYITEQCVCVCVPQLMGLVRRGWDKGEGRGEDKGQDKGRRLEEDQTEQMCRNRNVRTMSAGWTA